MPDPTLADTPLPVRITTTGTLATVHVGDTDLSRHLRGYTLEHRADQLPLLVLYGNARGGAVFEGLARVVVGEEPADPAQAIVDFLSSLDPQALENAALNRDDLGGERYDLTRAMLRQITDWAQGKGT